MPTPKLVFVTGGSDGLGKEFCKQMAALDPAPEKIILTSRSAERGGKVCAALASETGKDIFEAVALDTADPASIQACAAALPSGIDAYLMNASSPNAGVELGAHGVCKLFQDKTLGHMELLDALIKADKLTKGGRVIFSSSELVRTYDPPPHQTQQPCATSPAAGGVRGVSPRQPPLLPASAAVEHLLRSLASPRLPASAAEKHVLCARFARAPSLAADC
jgi:NAD(P)-dependent dehydrogenase (short-subunit alcohol dehydrogenase family)